MGGRCETATAPVVRAKHAQNLPLVDNLHVLVLKKVAHLGLPTEHGRGHLTNRLLLVLGRHGQIPLLQPTLSLPAEQEYILNLQEDDTGLKRERALIR